MGSIVGDITPESVLAAVAASNSHAGSSCTVRRCVVGNQRVTKVVFMKHWPSTLCPRCLSPGTRSSLLSCPPQASHAGFEYVCGRWKLAGDLEPVSLLKTEILEWEIRKKKKTEAEEGKKRAILQQHRRVVVDFLARHGFEDVNQILVTHVSCWGSKRYETPLHTAAKENDPNMLKLLVEFGADPYQKDSSGKNVFGYLLRRIWLSRNPLDDPRPLLSVLTNRRPRGTVSGPRDS